MSLLRGQEQTVVVAEVDVCPPGHKDQNRRKKGKYMQYRKSWSRRCAVFLSAILLLGLMSTGIVAAAPTDGAGAEWVAFKQTGSSTAAGDSVWPEGGGVYTATGTGYDLSMVVAATGESRTVEAEFWAEAGAIPGLLLNAARPVIRWRKRNRPSVSCCKVLGRPAAILRAQQERLYDDPSDKVITQPVTFAGRNLGQAQGGF